MCPISDLNRDTFQRYALNVMCLPIPPIGHLFEQVIGFEPMKNRFAVCWVNPLPYTCVFTVGLFRIELKVYRM